MVFVFVSINKSMVHLASLFLLNLIHPLMVKIFELVIAFFVNNENVKQMNPTDFNYHMQSLIRNDATRDGNLLLEAMNAETYCSINDLPSFLKQ